MSAPAISILKVLAYFDMFQYPLTREEMVQFLDTPVQEEMFTATLDQLIRKSLLFEADGFYSLQNNPLLVTRRLDGNRKAASMLQTGYGIARFLFQFPFVRGIGISGSLSKYFAGEDADIDFFIITSRNRLWLARSFMHLFKQITYLTGKSRWYCMNYYIDEEALLINEQNIFTATEVVTVIPVCGQDAFDGFFQTNHWGFHYFPNQLNSVKTPLHKDSSRWLKKAMEWLLNNRAGNRLDDYLMHFTRRRAAKNEQKKQKLAVTNQSRGFKTSKHCARPHPECFQKKILSRFDISLHQLEEEWNKKLMHDYSKTA